MLDVAKTKAFMEGIWDGEIIPALTDYIRIPNKSPAFDPDWEKHGHMDQVVELFTAWARKKLQQFPGAALDVVEKLGIERSFAAMADADVTLVVIDLSAPFEAQDTELVEKAGSQGKCVIAGNKSDLVRQAEIPDSFGTVLPVSALTGAGLPELRAALVESIAPRGQLEIEGGFITSVRHEQLLRETGEALEQARTAAGFGVPHEMLLLDLYAALRPIDAITGATTADDILNRIFSTFCIGK